MTKTPRHKLLQLADRYWSNPDVRLRSVNYKRRRRGLPERKSLDEIECSATVAERLPRGRYERFA